MGELLYDFLMFSRKRQIPNFIDFAIQGNPIFVETMQLTTGIVSFGLRALIVWEYDVARYHGVIRWTTVLPLQLFEL